tara:strand:+ start:62036 stop:64159 length:2124 start_codon:yes stop_codon:yes gene_type:complete
LKSALIQLDDSMKHLLGLPLRLQVAALCEGLKIGEPVECQQFAIRLVEIAGYGQGGIAERSLGPVELISGLSDRWRARHADAALRALAEGWGKLPTEVRKIALSLGRSRWVKVTKELSTDADAQTRITALSIAKDTDDPAFGVMVCSMLSDEHSRVRLSADRTLIAMVLGMFGNLDAEMLGEDFANIRDRRVTRMLGDPSVLELERCSMLAAIADAAWSFSSHRCRSPLLASLLLMDRQGGTAIEKRAFEKMRRLLSERNHPSHMPMRTVLRTTPAPILRERALRWLVIDPIAGVASARLEVAESEAEHCAVLDQMHLCVRPLRAKGLKRVRVATRQVDGAVVLEPRAPMLSREAFAVLGRQSKLGYLRWVAGLDLDRGLRRSELEPAMADSDGLVRLYGCSVADPLDLVDYLYDGDDSIARHAAMRWSSVGSGVHSVGSGSWSRRFETARVNGRSGSAWVRRVANEEVERLSMEIPSSPASRVQARRLYQSDPARFVRLVREMLHQPSKRSAGLGMVLALGLESRFEMDLLSLVNEPMLEGRVSASLVRGLSAIDSVAAAQAVLRSLESDDQRVVANAIESAHTPIGSLIEYKGDANHRVRSSAIRRMLLSNVPGGVVEGAAEDLGAMLKDHRVSHRLAGVWAAQRVLEPRMARQLSVRFEGWRDLVTTLNEMTLHEADDAVRGRADQCVHRMLVSHRAGLMEGSR